MGGAGLKKRQLEGAKPGENEVIPQSPRSTPDVNPNVWSQERGDEGNGSGEGRGGRQQNCRSNAERGLSKRINNTTLGAVGRTHR